jgi:hypothetical protein
MTWERADEILTAIERDHLRYVREYGVEAPTTLVVADMACPVRMSDVIAALRFYRREAM